LKICDVGCATGDFLYYLSNSIKDAEFFGIDIREDLLTKAKQEVSNCNFILGDISDSKTLPKKQFDIVFMTGVLSIFDDYEIILENFLQLIKPKGIGYIFGIFNSYDIDVLIKIHNSKYQDGWESGWNLFSKSSIVSFEWV